MDDKRIEELEKTLNNLYKNLDLIRKETITHLGNKDALHIIDFHANNWIDLIKWISSKYNGEEQKIVYLQFFRLFKEIYWLQFLFHSGNYPVIYRNLRYIWEMISQAYYIDSKHPHLSLDEQIEKTKEIEKTMYGWTLIESVLMDVLNINKEEMRTRFKPLWDYLNKHAHPSAKQMDIVATEDFSSFVTDSFNENLARDALRATGEIFDIVDMIIFKKFSKIKELALKYEFIDEWAEFLPNTVSIIKSESK